MGAIRSIGLAISCATFLFLALTFLANQTAIDYHLSTWIGRNDEPFGFQNFVLPRLLASLLAFWPAVLGAIAIVRWCQRETPQFSVRIMFAAITIVAIGVGLAVGEPLESVLRPIRAALVIAYLIVLSGILAWAATRRPIAPRDA